MPRRAGFRNDCKYIDCERSVHAWGYCHTHYVQARAGRGMAPIRAAAGRPPRTYNRCQFNGCELPTLAKGYCPGHYRQNHKGQPLTPLRRNQ